MNTPTPNFGHSLPPGTHSNDIERGEPLAYCARCDEELLDPHPTLDGVCRTCGEAELANTDADIEEGEQ